MKKFQPGGPPPLELPPGYRWNTINNHWETMVGIQGPGVKDPYAWLSWCYAKNLTDFWEAAYYAQSEDDTDGRNKRLIATDLDFDAAVRAVYNAVLCGLHNE